MTTTKERPILMSAPMILALLDGRKTQTRRIVKPQPPQWVDCYVRSVSPIHWIPQGVYISDPSGCLGRGALSVRLNDMSVKCPYEVGMRLWVRETFAIESNHDFMDIYSKPDNPLGPVRWHEYDEGGQYFECPRYRASEPDALLVCDEDEVAPEMRWRPSIHMPRWASRITLEITDIRVQRVQEISHHDALAEGVAYDVSVDGGAPVPRFRELWDSINGSKYPWDANPWVWAITFKKLEDR